MEPHFRNYQINHKFQEKISGCYCWKLRKSFRNYLSRLAKALNPIRAGIARAVEEMFMRKLTKN